MTCYAKGQGRIGFSDGDKEIVFGPDGNVEAHYDACQRRLPLRDVDGAAETFWQALRYNPPGRVDIRFATNVGVTISADGEITLDYKPNLPTKLLWEAIAFHWPGRPQTVAPKPVRFTKGYDDRIAVEVRQFQGVDECCVTYDAGYACPCPPTEPSSKPFDFDTYNGVKR